MKNKNYNILAIIFYLISLLILLFCISIRLKPNVYLRTNFRLFLLFLVCVMIYISGYILVNKLKYSKNILKIHLVIYFLIYTVTIFTLTLFDEIYGRQGFTLINWNKELFNRYLNTSFNIVPFTTIRLFAKGYTMGIVSFKNFIMNVLGNFCAFMPYAIFLPLMFKKINRFRNFFLTMVFIVLAIELLQFATMSGSCDIDDLVLNVMGASIVYLLTRIKCINRFIHEFFLYE